MEKVSINNNPFAHRINQILSYPHLSLFGVGLVILLDVCLYILKGELRYVQAIILLSVVPIIFLFFFPSIRNKLTNNSFTRSQHGVTNNIRLVVILSFIAIALTLVITHPTLYARPISYFILLSLAITLLMWELKVIGDQKRVKLLLLTIILVSLALRLVPMSMIPGLYFDDPAFHEGFTNDILLTGQVPANSAYTNFPLMHILEAIVSDVSEINFKESVVISITALQASIIPIFIFLVGRWTFEKNALVDGTQIGLYAALLFAISDIPIRYGLMGAFPTNFAMVVFIALIYLNLAKSNLKTAKVVSILLLITLILGHSLTSIAYLIFLFVSVFLICVHQYLFSPSIKVPVSNAFLVICVLTTTAYLIYTSAFHFRKLINTLFFQDSGVVASFSTKGGLSYSQVIPIHEYFLNTLPQIILISVAFIGVLFLLPRLFSFPKALVIIGASLIFFGFGAFGLVFSFGNAPDRFMYYSFLLLPIASAFGLVLLPYSSKIGKVLFLFLIISLPFLMISNSISNNDSPIYTHDLTPQRYISESEEISLETIFRVSQQPICADNDIYYFQKKYQLEDKIEVLNLFTLSNVIDREGIITRSFYLSKPVYSKGLYRINYDIDKEMGKTHNKIFNSNSIVYFLK